MSAFKKGFTGFFGALLGFVLLVIVVCAGMALLVGGLSSTQP